VPLMCMVRLDESEPAISLRSEAVGAIPPRHPPGGCALMLSSKTFSTPHCRHFCDGLSQKFMSIGIVVRLHHARDDL
jgi:hypothetical protein